MHSIASPSSTLPGTWQALDWIGAPLALLDLQGRILFANAALEDCVGVSRRMLLGTECAPLLSDAAPLRRALERARAQDGAGLRFATELVSARHGRLPMQASAHLAGPGQGVLLQLWPLHPHARHEREQRLREQGDAHRELVRNLAHEIRNPLGGIRGAAQLLELELPTPELADYTRVIIREADRLRALVDRLLEPQRQPPQLAGVNIHEVCEHVRALVQAEHGSGLALLRDYDASIPELHADRGQLVQALLNVVRNAAQALAGRIAAGDAQIVLRTRVAHQVALGAHQHRVVLVLDVIDNGPGVPEALRERIFYPLVSGRDGGSGLGLALAQTFVQRHHGLLECDSVPGCTDFHWLIPLP